MIYGPDGNPVTSKRWAHGASRNRFRGPLLLSPNKGVDELIPMTDRRTLAALSRRLVFNFGPAKDAINQKASYSVGCAWSPVYSGSDLKQGREAASWLRNVWHPVCDIHGSNWHESLEIVSKSMDRDGEAFVLLTKSEGGFPHIQHIPAHMVWSKANLEEVEEGTYAGLKIDDGVITNKQGRAVAYRVNKDDKGDEFDDISARDLIHVFERSFAEQKRGYSAFSHALDDIKNSMSSQELETIRQTIVSGIFLIERGEGPDLGDPGNTLSIDATNKEGFVSQTNQPGIRHVSGNESLEMVKHENPGDIWESFQDRLLRMSISVIWPYSLVWKAVGQGTADRAEVVKARKFVEARQKKLDGIATRADTYAIAVESQRPKRTFSLPGNMLKWSHDRPERLTLDDGREARALQEGVDKGHVSEAEYHAFKGKGLEQHYREQADAKILRARIAKEASENEEGIEIAPEDLGIQVAPSGPIMEPAQ